MQKIRREIQTFLQDGVRRSVPDAVANAVANELKKFSTSREKWDFVFEHFAPLLAARYQCEARRTRNHTVTFYSKSGERDDTALTALRVILYKSDLTSAVGAQARAKRGAKPPVKISNLDRAISAYLMLSTTERKLFHKKLLGDR